MGAFGRYRQIRIDRRGERMHQFRPAGIPNPQSAAAIAAETSLPWAFIAGPGLFVPKIGVKDGDLVFAINLERRIVRPEAGLKFRKGSNSEVLSSQRLSSATKRAAELIQHPISQAICSQFGQEQRSSCNQISD